MKNFIFNVICIIILVAHFQTSIAQTAPTLGAAAGFALFTSAGEFANTGTTTITGDIGNLTGSVTGTPVTVTGTPHFGDASSVTVSARVISAYADLSSAAINPCGTILTTPIGNTTLLPGIYCSTTATVLTGNLTLDGGGVSGGIFIIKINGEFSVNAPVNITLTNGASLDNVYWQVNGAFNLGAGVAFKGTVINAGAISLATGASISGRALSTAGKISLDNNNVSNAEVSLPVTLLSFNVKSGEHKSALLIWETTAETNSDRFEIEHSVNGKIWKTLETIAAKGESRELVTYSFSDQSPRNGINLYRLKMIDQDETFTYSRVRNINMEAGNETVLYPNPSSDQLTLEVNDLSKVERVQFNDLSGKLILDQKKGSLSNISPNFSINHFAAGLYLIRVTRTDGSVDVLKIVKR